MSKLLKLISSNEDDLIIINQIIHNFDEFKDEINYLIENNEVSLTVKQKRILSLYEEIESKILQFRPSLLNTKRYGYLKNSDYAQSLNENEEDDYQYGVHYCSEKSTNLREYLKTITFWNPHNLPDIFFKLILFKDLEEITEIISEYNISEKQFLNQFIEIKNSKDLPTIAVKYNRIDLFKFSLKNKYKINSRIYLYIFIYADFRFLNDPDFLNLNLEIPSSLNPFYCATMGKNYIMFEYIMNNLQRFDGPYLTFKCMRNIVDNNDLKMLKLYQKYRYKYPHDIELMDYAIIKGKNEIILYLHDVFGIDIPKKDIILIIAAFKGDMTLFNIGHNLGIDINNNILNYAVLGNNINMIEMLLEFGLIPDITTSFFAAYCGNLDHLKMCHDYGVIFNRETLSLASTEECKKYINEVGFLPNNIESSNKEFINYYLVFNSKLKISDEFIDNQYYHCNSYINYKHMTLLDEVIRQNNLSDFKYICINTGFFSNKYLEEIILYNDNIEFIKILIEYGCSISYIDLIKCVEYNKFDFFKILHKYYDKKENRKLYENIITYHSDSSKFIDYLTFNDNDFFNLLNSSDPIIYKYKNKYVNFELIRIKNGEDDHKFVYSCKYGSIIEEKPEIENNILYYIKPEDKKLYFYGFLPPYENSNTSGIYKIYCEYVHPTILDSKRIDDNIKYNENN
jgi:hypothetical protein